MLSALLTKLLRVTTDEIMTFEVLLESVDNPGKFTFITVEDCKDLKDCVNQIQSDFSHQFIIHQIKTWGNN